MSVPARHGTFDLDPMDDQTVSVTCADPECLEPLGTASILTWGTLAENHYWRRKAAAEVGTG